MMNRFWIYLLFIFFSLIQITLYYPRLPERVASHFGGDGTPNGYSTKGSFCFVYLILIILLPLVFIFGIPFLISKVPSSMINLPNKNYWLAPERREETISYINVQLTVMGYGLMVFLILIMELTFKANLKVTKSLSSGPFLFFLCAFIAFDLFWTVKLLVHFSKKKESDSYQIT